jgi:uncharacterized membrane protein
MRRWSRAAPPCHIPQRAAIPNDSRRDAQEGTVKRSGLLVLSLLTLSRAGPRNVAAQQPTVHAVLFYSPICPHCERVIQNVLPGVFTHFGGLPQFHAGSVGHLLTNGRLEILMVNVLEPEGGALYRTSILMHHLGPERQGVPQLVCGDSVLVGEFEIPDQFPGLITAGWARGGVPWPAIAGLAAAFPSGYGPSRPGDSSAPARAPVASPTPGVATPHAPQPAVSAPESGAASQPQGVHAAAALVSRTAGSPFRRTWRTDPVGGSLALIVLAAMVLSMGLTPTRVPGMVPRPWERAVPLVVVVGMGVAAYLAYVEVTGAVAVCGPVGDCNAVQQSRYARLAGIPIAVLGLLGYGAILAAWIGARKGPSGTRRWAAVLAFALSVVGTIASAVLTALEPFAIGAVCAWCLTSAVLMTLLLWLLARPAHEAVAALRGAPPRS